MRHKDYLSMVRNDLLSRMNGGNILINDSTDVRRRDCSRKEDANCHERGSIYGLNVRHSSEGRAVNALSS